MRTLALSLATVVTVSASAFGQSTAAGEKELRDIIARLSAGERVPDVELPDVIFWSGPMVKPTVGREKPQLRPGTSAVPGGRSDAKTDYKLVQLQVATGGDMAYQYSTFRSSFVRTSDRQKVEFEGALLTVWRRVDGKWRVAAEFRRPYDDTPAAR